MIRIRTWNLELRRKLLYCVACKMGKKGGIFRYADGVDKLLMVFGTLGSIGDGLMTPLTMFVLSRVINEYGGATLSFSNEVVDRVCRITLFNELRL